MENKHQSITQICIGRHYTNTCVLHLADIFMLFRMDCGVPQQPLTQNYLIIPYIYVSLSISQLLQDSCKSKTNFTLSKTNYSIIQSPLFYTCSQGFQLIVCIIQLKFCFDIELHHTTPHLPGKNMAKCQLIFEWITESNFIL